MKCEAEFCDEAGAIQAAAGGLTPFNVSYEILHGLFSSRSGNAKVGEVQRFCLESFTTEIAMSVAHSPHRCLMSVVGHE